MFVNHIFALLCALAGTSSALVIRDSPITLPLVRRFKLAENSTLPDLDRARATGLKALAHRNAHASRAAGGAWPVAATSGGTTYVTEVRVPRN